MPTRPPGRRVEREADRVVARQAEEGLVVAPQRVSSAVVLQQQEGGEFRQLDAFVEDHRRLQAAVADVRSTAVGDRHGGILGRSDGRGRFVANCVTENLIGWRDGRPIRSTSPGPRPRRRAGDGAAVALGATGPHVLERVEELVAGGATAAGFQADLRDRTAAAEAVADIVSTLGPVDVLVNNAGMGTRAEPARSASLVDLDPEDWDRQLQMTLTSAF